MGLDMWLTARRPLETHERVRALLAGALPNMPGPLIGVECLAMYWRKANAIHAWFVENVQGGHDDCKDYYVSRRRLYDLLTTIQTVLEAPNKALELLPTREGFFFGGVQYDDEYFEMLRDSQKKLEAVCAFVRAPEGSRWEFFYRSSW